uniref:Uncharacterized protein n=1 Tax=Enterovibrio norvegicus TaxID=188144 RepID=A0A0H4A1W6_9GAMM|nr:hypothetical protein [Enterovibrio norvegicus]
MDKRDHLKVENFADVVNAAKLNGVTQKEIAARLRVSGSLVTQWKSEAASDIKTKPTYRALVDLADELGVELKTEPVPDIPRKLPSKKARIISASLMFLLIASLLSALAWLSLDAKKQHGTFDIGVFGEVLKARLNTYDEHCQLDAENCADFDK